MICFPFLFYSGFVNGFLLKWSSIQLAFFFYLVFFSPRHKCMEGSFVIFGILAYFFWLFVCSQALRSVILVMLSLLFWYDDVAKSIATGRVYGVLTHDFIIRTDRMYSYLSATVSEYRCIYCIFYRSVCVVR